MSQQHQNASLHAQFQQSPHRQRVCSDNACVESGQFVYAERALKGFRGVGWDPAYVPEKLERLYCRVDIHYVLSNYYSDGAGGWIFWKDYTCDYTVKLDKDTGTVVYFKLEGSLNGVIAETDLCTGLDFEMDFDDFVVETDPAGGTGHHDLPPWYFSYPSGGFDVQTVSGISEGGATYTYEAIDSGGTFAKIVTTITNSDPLDTGTVKTLVCDMLATTPLTPGGPIAMTGNSPADYSAISGLWGFTQLGADYDFAYLRWDVTGPCPADRTLTRFLDKVSFIEHQDDHCRCSFHYSLPAGGGHPALNLWVYRDRRQTFMPAEFLFSIPGAPGGGAGALYAEGAHDVFLYGYTSLWVWNPVEAKFRLDHHGQPEVLSVYTCSAFGKKSLLNRRAEDVWTAHINSDTGVPTCLGSNTKKCHRYYFPSGADSAVDSATSKVFSFTDPGRVYRGDLSPLTVEMDGDCPLPEPGEISCPNGDWASVSAAANPCGP